MEDDTLLFFTLYAQTLEDCPYSSGWTIQKGHSKFNSMRYKIKTTPQSWEGPPIWGGIWEFEGKTSMDIFEFHTVKRYESLKDKEKIILNKITKDKGKKKSCLRDTDQEVAE